MSEPTYTIQATCHHCGHVTTTTGVTMPPFGTLVHFPVTCGGCGKDGATSFRAPRVGSDGRMEQYRMKVEVTMGTARGDVTIPVLLEAP